MTRFPTEQTAYVGKFAILDKAMGVLIRGGGVDAPRPRLYETAEAAIQAAEELTEWFECEPVELV